MRNPNVSGPAHSVPRATQVPAGPGRCDVCGAPTIEVRCKIICGRCGYTRDCSDP